MDKGIIRHIAELSNISLSSCEEERYGKELTKIVEYISKIKEVSEEKDNIQLKHQKMRLREDEVKLSLPISLIKKLSSYIEDNQFKVPKEFRRDPIL